MRRSRLGRVGRGGAFLAGAVVASLVSTVTVSAATGSFSDVPDSHPFFDDIEAVAGACIAAGYQDGTYRPAAPVTRQAMAAFLHRTASKVVVGQKAGAVPNPTFGSAGPGASSIVAVAVVEVTVPDLPGTCDVPVEVHGNVSVGMQGSFVDACHALNCDARAVVTKNGTPADDSMLMARLSDATEVVQFSPGWTFHQQDGTTAWYRIGVSGYNVKTGGAAVATPRGIHAVIHPMDATPTP